MANETVKIKSKDFEGGFVIINKSDFNEAEHEMFIEGEKENPPAAKEKLKSKSK